MVMHSMEVAKLLTQLLEASVYVCPKDHGLSGEELLEAGGQLGLKQGEITDSLRMLGGTHARYSYESQRYVLDQYGIDTDFHQKQEPEYRNPDAFEFARSYLNELAREVGQKRAQAPRDTIVAAAVQGGIPEHDVDVAITALLINGLLEESHAGVGLTKSGASYAMPSAQLKEMENRHGIPARTRARLEECYVAVKDVISRRSDGRPPASQPFQAMESMLDSIGQERFRLWWTRTVAELKLANPAHQATTISVLSASLAEAALAFVVTKAQEKGLMVNLGSKTTQWKFVDLLRAAQSGAADKVILSQPLYERGKRLNEIRQRIHAGHLMNEYPSGNIPDLKPEEAREALETAEQLVRQVLEWLERNLS
ncbi:MAG: hypothetical protein RBU30_09640 [Polyangia bacterium]|jgi:hypothetical protein|nr:hypothetical protein [Polyangia bacterium]